MEIRLIHVCDCCTIEEEAVQVSLCTTSQHVPRQTFLCTGCHACSARAGSSISALLLLATLVTITTDLLLVTALLTMMFTMIITITSSRSRSSSTS